MALDSKPRVLVFASGTEDAGGSGFANLVKYARSPLCSLDCTVVAVVSNHATGGVCRHALKLGVPFIHFNGPYTRAAYADIVFTTGAEWVALSGWLKRVSGLDSRRTFNVHPALLSSCNGRFGGEEMYGTEVHRAVHAALHNDEITHSGVSMHFITDEYDAGPVFFEHAVPLQKGMTVPMIQKKVHALEHHWQPRITNLVIHGKITWDGHDPRSLTVPPGYQFLPTVY